MPRTPQSIKIPFGFWKDVHDRCRKEGRPIFTLAPMANVTDAAFRHIIAKYSDMGKTVDTVAVGGPDVMWTEFVSADGLCSVGREVLVRDLAYDESERPIVTQLFTAHPDKMFHAARLSAELGFDGLDINMGCPDRSVEKQGSGAALMKNPSLAKEIIEAARQGVMEVAKQKKKDKTGTVAEPIPVSVKTRLGYNKVDIESWLGFLLEQNLPALIVHLRTRTEMSDVPAHWELMQEITQLRNTISQDTIILGNGDVIDLADARKKVAESGADGVMFGRAIFGNPWLFKQTSMSSSPIPIPERLHVMVEHTFLFEKMLGDIKSFAIMKKHYKAYINGWDGAKELRMRLMEAQSATEVADIVQKYLMLSTS
jgi:nifR3 family TIM-barrel protein